VPVAEAVAAAAAEAEVVVVEAEAAVEAAAEAEAAVVVVVEAAAEEEVEGKEGADRAAGVDLAVAARSSCLLETTPGLCRRKQSSDGGGRLRPR
jgi:hypothetical protein